MMHRLAATAVAPTAAPAAALPQAHRRSAASGAVLDRLHGHGLRPGSAVGAGLALLGLWAALAEPAAAQGTTVTRSSGLSIQSLKDGSGPSPKATDTVRVHYRGTLADGKEFDSSYKRNEPAEFPLNRVIPCWTEGLQLMKVGGKSRLTCPPAIAYGSRGAGGVIPPNATLTFEVELLGIAAR